MFDSPLETGIRRVLLKTRVRHPAFVSESTAVGGPTTRELKKCELKKEVIVNTNVELRPKVQREIPRPMAPFQNRW